MSNDPNSPATKKDLWDMERRLHDSLKTELRSELRDDMYDMGLDITNTILNGVDRMFAEQNKRIDDIEASQDMVINRIDKLDDRIDKLDDKFDDFKHYVVLKSEYNVFKKRVETHLSLCDT